MMKAEKTLSRAVSIKKTLLGDDHPLVAETLTLWALALEGQSRYSDAQTALLRSQEIRLKHFGSASAESGYSLCQLADLAETLQDYPRADSLFRQGVDLLKKYGGAQEARLEASGNYGWLQSQLGDAAKRSGNKTESAQRLKNAESLLGEAISLCDSLGYSADHLNRATLLNNLAITLSREERWADSIASFRKAERILEANNQFENMALLNSSIGRLYVRMDEPEKSLPFFEKAMALGNTHLAQQPQLLNIYLSYGQALIAMKDPGKAEQVFTDACAKYEAFRVSLAPDDRSIYASAKSPFVWLAITRVEQGKANAAWDAVECDLGRGLLEAMGDKRLCQWNQAERTRETSLREAIRKNEMAARAEREGGHSQRADSLETTAVSARRKLAEFRREMAAKYPATELRAVSLADARRVIGPDAGVVGWLRIPKEEYVYLVRNTGDVLWKKVDTGSSDSLAVALRDALESRKPWTNQTEQLSRRLFHNRFGALMPELSRLKTLYVVPSGPMVGLPMDVLDFGKGQLCLDRWDISRIPSVTLLAALADRPAAHRKGKLLALGDAPFKFAAGGGNSAGKRWRRSVLVAEGGLGSDNRRASRGRRCQGKDVPTQVGGVAIRGYRDRKAI
jgi:tetratricopeptide (TPR) repeat protein